MLRNVTPATPDPGLDAMVWERVAAKETAGDRIAAIATAAPTPAAEPRSGEKPLQAVTPARENQDHETPY